MARGGINGEGEGEGEEKKWRRKAAAEGMQAVVMAALTSIMLWEEGGLVGLEGFEERGYGMGKGGTDLRMMSLKEFQRGSGLCLYFILKVRLRILAVQALFGGGGRG